jgi:glycosyltransferase involved in cell wall biosynthesis
MKILQSCGSNSRGGLEMIAFRTSLLLSKRGHEVTLITRADSILEKQAQDNELSVIPIFSADSKIINSIRKLSRLIQDNAFDAIHTHLSHDLWTIVPALRFAGSKSRLFLTKHMGSFVRKKDLFHRYLYNRIDHIFAISAYVEESVIKTCPVKKEKISILSPGVSLQEFDKRRFNKNVIRKKINIPEDVVIIAIIGRISPGKGHEEILQAVKILLDRRANRFMVLVAGDASKNEKEFEQRIMKLSDDLNISSAVRFLGFRNDVPEIMAITDILVFPSHEESFGVTLIEALAMGLPVIASNNAGIPDIIVNGETGILIPPKDPHSLANAISGLINNTNLRSVFGTNGRKRAEKYFDEEEIISSLEKFYINGNYRNV